jgi:hypothetical protein
VDVDRQVATQCVGGRRGEPLLLKVVAVADYVVDDIVFEVYAAAPVDHEAAV